MLAPLGPPSTPSCRGPGRPPANHSSLGHRHRAVAIVPARCSSSTAVSREDLAVESTRRTAVDVLYLGALQPAILCAGVAAAWLAAAPAFAAEPPAAGTGQCHVAQHQSPLFTLADSPLGLSFTLRGEERDPIEAFSLYGTTFK